MDAHDDLIEWAEQEFGHAELGDRRRSTRLVEMAARVAARPQGTVTAVFDSDGERQGAYGLLENPVVTAEAVAKASYLATLGRCQGQSFVFVPVDGTSLNLTDSYGAKGFGSIGSRRVGARGLKVLNAMVVAADGVPQGLCGQRHWARPLEPAEKPHWARRLEDKETHYWIEVLQQVRALFQVATPTVQPWFQLDREGDAWPIWLDLLSPGQWATIRSARDRRLQPRPGETSPRYLWATVESQPVLGTYELDVPARGNQPARVATMALYTCPVALEFHDKWTHRRYRPPTLDAVFALEISPGIPPEGLLEWRLLTTFPVKDFADAQLVVQGYAQRWRVEQFHRLWKSGQCDVEKTQLHSIMAVMKWAAIHAAVAMRALRLTYLARHSPELPAPAALSRVEIAAIQHLHGEGKKNPTRALAGRGNALAC
jgi:hypothetical protein